MKFARTPIAQSLCLILGLNAHAIAQDHTQDSTQDHIQDYTQAQIETEIENVVVFGQQQSYLNPLVSTATKTDIDPLDTPVTVNVINQQFLADIRAESLADAYGYTTGLGRSGVTANSFTLRGIAADLSSVQVNGLPGLASRFGSPTTANVEQVEILKGPASIMYGQIQPGGLINIVTKKPQDQASVSVDVSLNTYATDVSGASDDNSLTATIDATGPLNESDTWLYRLIVSAQDNNSYRNDVDSQNYYLFPTLTYRHSDETAVTFGVELQSENRVADNGLAVLNNDIKQIADIDTHYQSAGDSSDDSGLVAFATFNHQLNDNFDLTVDWRSVWHEDERDLYENNAVVDSSDSVKLRDRTQLNIREYHYVDVRTTGQLWTGDIEHQVLFGANIGTEESDFKRETYAKTTVDFYAPSDLTATDQSAYVLNHRITKHKNYGLYAQDSIALSQSWSVMAGLRYTRQDTEYNDVQANASRGTSSQQRLTSSSDAFVSQAGVVYKIMPDSSLYLSYGESFNPNSIEDTDANGDTFEPEEGRQYELGIKSTLFNDTTSLNIAYFDIEKSNVVDENEAGDNELLGKVISTGIEAELLMMPVENWQIKLGYAYVDANVSGSLDPAINGNRVAGSALNEAYVWSKYNLPNEIAGGLVSATLGINYESSRYTSSDVDTRVELPSYTTVDIGVHYEFGDYRTSLNLENITDELYYIGGSKDSRLYVGDPRNITLSVSGKF